MHILKEHKKIYNPNITNYKILISLMVIFKTLRKMIVKYFTLLYGN